MLHLLAQEGAMQEPFFELDATVAMFISGVLIPILVGLVTKLGAPPALKAILHALLAAIAGLIITATTLDGVAVFSRESLVSAFIAWITGVAAYLGFLKPTQISPAVNHATANFGIGPKNPNPSP
jgi:chromate transport protein ChrA